MEACENRIGPQPKRALIPNHAVPQKKLRNPSMAQVSWCALTCPLPIETEASCAKVAEKISNSPSMSPSYHYAVSKSLRFY